jgi:succinoglycan biosynthesis protein ExoA
LQQFATLFVTDPMPQLAAHRSRVLVVIPCLNEEKTLEKIVDTAVAWTGDMHADIVIADGGSVDGTQKIARALAAKFSNVRLLDNPKRIQSAAVNLAVQEFGSTADYLIRLDAHADYPEDYARILVAEANATHAASVVVGMKTLGRHWFQRAVAAAQNSRLGTGGSPHRTAVREGRWTDHGHHALMKVEAFRLVGGYDESFSHNEDAELDFRLRKASMQIWLTSRTSLTHYPRDSPQGLFRQYFGYGEGRARTLFKHRVWPRFRQLAPIFILPMTLLALTSPYHWLAGAPLLIWALACVIYGLVLAIKTRDWAVAASGPAAMVMHWAWSLGFWKSVGGIFGRRRWRASPS